LAHRRSGGRTDAGADHSTFPASQLATDRGTTRPADCTPHHLVAAFIEVGTSSQGGTHYQGKRHFS